MNIKNLLNSLAKGELMQVYLLFGEERYFFRQAEKALIESALPPEDRDIGLQVFEQDPPVAELVQSIESAPFFGGKNVIIVRDTKLFRSGKGEDQEANDKADAKLMNCLQSMPQFSHVMFITGDKVDKRRKLYKLVEKIGTVIEVSALKQRDVREWVNGSLRDIGKTISSEALDYLNAGISFMPQVSIGFLENEIQKVALHAGSRNQINIEDVKAALAGVPEVNIFAMIDAMSQKNITLALRLLDEQLATGEPPMRLLMLVARQTRALLICKELSAQGQTAQEIAKTLGLHPFVAEKMLGQARRFTDAKLKQALIMISDADRSIKSGRASNVSLESILIEMCK